MNDASKNALEEKIRRHPAACALWLAFTVAAFVAIFVFWRGRFEAAKHEVEIVCDAHAAPCVEIGTLGGDQHGLYSEDIAYEGDARDRDVEIEATGRKAQNAWGAEIWIQKISTESGDLDWAKVVFDDGWTEKASPIGAAGKAFVSYGEGASRKLRFNVRAQRLDITYSRHQWSGIMRVTIDGKSREIDTWQSSFAPETLHCSAPPREGDVAKDCRFDRFFSAREIGPAMRLKVSCPSGSIVVKGASFDGEPVRFDDRGTIRLPSRFSAVILPAVLTTLAVIPALALFLWALYIVARKRPFAVFAALVILCKLWIVGGDEIRASPYDARGYMLSSLNDFWNLEYSAHAYDRQPGYPLAIMSGRELGLPLRVWLELLYCAACLALATALPRLRLPKWSAYAALALMVFNPLTFPVMAFGYQDAAYAPFFLFFVAGMLHALPPGRERYFASIFAGTAAALVWNTRPEHILVVFALVVFALAIAFVEWSRSRTLRRAAAEIVKCVVPIVVLIAGATLAVCAAGRATEMGSFSASSFQLKGFTSLYDELLAIRPEHPEAYHPIPADVRQKAYAASPSLAKIKDAMEGPVLDVYRPMAAKDGAANGDFGVYAFWGLRLAPWYVQKWESAAQLDRYYAHCAGELRRAREKGVYESRRVYVHFVEPDASLWLPYLGEGMAAYWKILSRTDAEGLFPEQGDEGALFDKAALRRGALARDNEAIWANPSRDSVKFAKNLCARVSAITVWIAAVIAIPATALIIIFLFGKPELETTPVSSALMIIACAFAGRFALMSLMHAVAFTAETRYIMAVAPLPALFAVAAAAYACHAIAHRFWRRDN